MDPIIDTRINNKSQYLQYYRSGLGSFILPRTIRDLLLTSSTTELPHAILSTDRIWYDSQNTLPIADEKAIINLLKEAGKYNYYTYYDAKQVLQIIIAEHELTTKLDLIEHVISKRCVLGMKLYIVSPNVGKVLEELHLQYVKEKLLSKKRD